MTPLENIKNRLIDRIMATRNERLLEAIDNILDSTQSDDMVKFSSEQIEMLMMSEEDIKNGNIISESELDKSDSEWLK